MAQAAFEQRAPKFWAQGPFLLRRQPPNPAGITATAATVAQEEALPGPRLGPPGPERPPPRMPSLTARRAPKPDRKLVWLRCPGDSWRGGGALARAEPRKRSVRGWGEALWRKENMGTHGPGDAAASSLGPAFRQGLGALQCMPGVVVRRGRPSDSEVSSCWGRWSCCNRGRRRLRYQLVPGRRLRNHLTVWLSWLPQFTFRLLAFSSQKIVEPGACLPPSWKHFYRGAVDRSDMLSGVVPRLQCDPSNIRSASKGWACSCMHSLSQFKRSLYAGIWACVGE